MIGAAQGQKMQTFFGINAGSAVALIAYVQQIFTPLESIGMENPRRNGRDEPDPGLFK